MVKRSESENRCISMHGDARVVLLGLPFESNTHYFDEITCISV